MIYHLTIFLRGPMAPFCSTCAQADATANADATAADAAAVAATDAATDASVHDDGA